MPVNSSDNHDKVIIGRSLKFKYSFPDLTFENWEQYGKGLGAVLELNDDEQISIIPEKNEKVLKITILLPRSTKNKVNEKLKKYFSKREIERFPTATSFTPRFIDVEELIE
ncbi:hypothetical protein [Streptococcus sp. S784/96/1]|uniref:hypothetical protein n=1 Tax=Streptococcus sp. S784/96/1 TaxID=2653499 RepID=UPI0013873D7C|nr:hypothetical protein [Streptococcus sp. S784/96/1]